MSKSLIAITNLKLGRGDETVWYDAGETVDLSDLTDEEIEHLKAHKAIGSPAEAVASGAVDSAAQVTALMDEIEALKQQLGDKSDDASNKKDATSAPEATDKAVVAQDKK